MENTSLKSEIYADFAPPSGRWMQNPCFGKSRGPRGAYFPMHPDSRLCIVILYPGRESIGNYAPYGWVELTVLILIHSRPAKKNAFSLFPVAKKLSH